VPIDTVALSALQRATRATAHIDAPSTATKRAGSIAAGAASLVVWCRGCACPCG
jgi:hypothetical protein